MLYILLISSLKTFLQLSKMLNFRQEAKVEHPCIFEAIQSNKLYTMEKAKRYGANIQTAYLDSYP